MKNTPLRLLLSVTAVIVLASAAWLVFGGRVLRSDVGPLGPAVQSEEELYADWAHVLGAHVNASGRVDYAALKAEPEPLSRFVALLRDVGPESRPDLFDNEAKRLAYYLNAYNAFMLFQVSEAYPGVESVYDNKLAFFLRNRFEMDRSTTNLYALENDIVRARFAEPRVHFALNCASIGCPELPAEPFVSSRLEEQLAKETSEFLHQRRNVVLDDGGVQLSRIFKWYAEDFTPSPLQWVRNQAPDLELPADAQVRFGDYDWSLNDQAREQGR